MPLSYLNLEPAVLTLDRNSCCFSHESLLNTAVKAGHLEMVQFFVAVGADVNRVCNRTEKTPLKEALDAKHALIAEYLRSMGAIEKSLAEAACDGDVALVCALTPSIDTRFHVVFNLALSGAGVAVGWF